MPDEGTQVEPTEATDAVQPTETPTELEGEPQGEPQPESQEGDGAALWDAAMPQFAGEYENISPGQRERMLAKGLTAQAQEIAAKGATSQADAPTESASTLSQPSVQQIPRLDVEAMRRGLGQEFGEEQANALMGALNPTINWLHGVGDLVVKTGEEQNARLREVVLPSEFQAALPKVAGAGENDIAAARKIYDSGDARTPELALKAAVFDREQELKANKPKRDASEEAKRKAAALRASGQAGAETHPGTTGVEFDGTPEQLQALMEREEAAERNK